MASVLALRSSIGGRSIELGADELIGDLKVNGEKINREVPKSD